MTTSDIAPATACTLALQPRDFGIGLLFWTIRDAVIVLDAVSGRIVLWSPAAEGMFGAPAAAAIGRPIESVVAEGLTSRDLIDHTSRAESGNGPVEATALRTNGTRLAVELTVSPVTATRVPGQFVLAIVRDVTVRKRSDEERVELARREAAQAADERFRVLFNGVADAILVADKERRYLDANPAALRLLGYTRTQLLRLRVEDIVASEVSWTGAEFAQMIAEGEWRGELNVRHRNGTLIPVEARVSVVSLPTGPVYLSTLRDVSERKELDRAQGEFLAAVSHDLKNPLTTIRAQAQLLRRRARRKTLTDTDQLVADLDVILSSTTRLASQLDELQDVARLRAGYALELTHEPTDLVALVQEAATAAQATTGHHRIRIAVPETALVGEWDALRLRRVLDNLLANAIKYSPGGGRIDLGVRREERAGAEWAVLTVQDEGVGIPAADVPHVFERFRRGSNVARQIAGTGIGLSGARQIVEQHGGTIDVESEEGRGSIFTVALPLARPDKV